jgi:hypothetical protein
LGACDIIFGLFDCCKRVRSTLCSSAYLLAASGVMLGAVSWGGTTWAIPLSLVALLLLGQTKKRTYSFVLMVSYYAGATWQILPGAAVFFGHHVDPFDIGLMWLSCSLLLGTPWALLWSPSAGVRLWRVPITLAVLAIPPLGVIGGASPLVAAGVILPGLGWAGLALTLLFCGLAASYPFRALVTTLVLALPANLINKPPELPADWHSVNTNFGGVGLDGRDPFREFAAVQFIEQTALTSRARVIVFPETVVPDWNQATEAYWARTIEILHQEGKTILVGANVFAVNGSSYFNSIIIRGVDSQEFHQRIPIPIAMW